MIPQFQIEGREQERLCGNGGDNHCESREEMEEEEKEEGLTP